jgi:replicative DNA helicase
MSLVLEYFKTYRAAPDLLVFEQLLSDAFAKRPPHRDVRLAWEKFLVEVRESDLTTLGYIKATAIEWSRDRVMERFVLDAAETINQAKLGGERNYDEIRQRLQVALAVGRGDESPFADYFKSTPQRLRAYESRMSEKVPTFFSPIDNILDGGVDRGEEFVIAAPTSRGKTSLLIQLGVVGPLYAGLRTLAISVEMSQLKFEMRVDRALTAMTKIGIRDDPVSAQATIDEVEKFKGHFRCYEYSARKCSVDTIDLLLTRLRDREGFVPQVLVVDYGSIMAPRTAYKERRFELASIYRELRDVAKEWDLVLWTAAQTNRESFTKRIVSLNDLSECIDIAQIADGLFCICQTEDEREKDWCRLYIAKMRDDEDRAMLPLTFERSIGRFLPRIISDDEEYES